ncbi:MAG: hypothetical protein ACREAU_00250 [Nitrosopumilaceae archaeon]
MTKNEKEATLTYLEFTLVSWGEEMQKTLTPKQLAVFYEGLYGVLNELDETLEDIIEPSFIN